MSSQSTSKTPFFTKARRRLIFRVVRLLILLFLIPKTTFFFIICGLIDFSRNRPLTFALFKKYFFGSGEITWILSPLNLLIDLFALSMKPIYSKAELPKKCQQEIDTVIRVAQEKNLAGALKDSMGDAERGMIFFKWYNKNIENSIHAEEYHQRFKYIKTIGISAFNPHKSTNRHFGPLRISLRVLYNLKPIDNDGVYIEVSGHKHIWHNNPLFIFDDSYIHQSFNNSDEIRYCMFIDIIRPTLCFHLILEGLLKLVQLSMHKVNHIFYKKWKTIR